MKWRLFLVAASIPAVASATEYLNEDFDAMPLGALSTQPGWESSSASVPLAWAGMVTDQQPLGGAHSVELLPPPPPFVLATRAVFTNFTCVPDPTNHAYLRASAWIWRENLTNSLSLRLLDAAAQGLLVQQDAYGAITVSDTASGFSTNTGVRWCTNQYAQLVLRYDRPNKRMAVDYHGTNILPWTTLGTNVLGPLSVFGVYRSSGATNFGRIFVDNMELASYPLSCWMWMRFDELAGRYAADEVGYFRPTPYLGSDDGRTPPVDDSLHAAGQDIADRSAWAGPQITNLPVARVNWSTTNWTLEGIVSQGLAGHGFELLELGDTTHALFDLTIGGGGSNNQIHANLRDWTATGNQVDYYGNLGALPTDGRWHHVAAVKSNTTLTVYVDYLPTSVTAAGFRSEGAYLFDLNARGCIGRTSNGATGTFTSDLVDEIRLTAAALSPAEFLQPSHPRMAAISPRPEAGTLQLDFCGIPSFTYQMQVCGSPLTGAWTNYPGGACTATAALNRITIGLPASGSGIRAARGAKGP